jgi:hypothetical protein
MNIDGPAPLLRRLAWFVGLWAASVAVLATIAYAIRSVLL